MGNVFSSTQQDQIHSRSQSGVTTFSDVQTKNLVYANVHSSTQTILQDEVQTSSGTCSALTNEIQTPSNFIYEVLTLPNTLNEIQSNSSVQPKKNLFLCQICNREFKFKKGLEKHIMRIHSDNRLPPSENICEGTFKCLDHFQTHTGACRKKNTVSCNTSDNRFKSKKYPRRRIGSHIEERPYRCNICNAAFKHLFYLQRHLKIHAKKKYHGPSVSKTVIRDEVSTGCNIQNDFQKYNSEVWSKTPTFTSLTSSDTTDTITDENDETQFTCQICNLPFRFRRDLRKHSRQHQDSIYDSKCNICEESFEGVDHPRTHFFYKEERSFQTSTSNDVFKYEEKLLRHYRTHNDERYYPCNICYQTFKQLHLLKTHMQTHKKTIEDDRAQNHFVDERKSLEQKFLKANLESHVGEERPYGCDTCDKRFKTKSVLLQHFSVHTDDKPFGCSLCEKTFKTKKYLMVHLRVHDSRRLFTSNLAESTTSPTNGISSSQKCIPKKITIRKEKNSPATSYKQTGAQFFYCDTCDERFKSKIILSQHFSIHEDIRPFTCFICKRTFKLKKYFSAHLHVHDVKKPFSRNLIRNTSQVRKIQTKKQFFRCDTCGKRFKTEAVFLQHLSIHETDGSVAFLGNSSEKRFHIKQVLMSDQTNGKGYYNENLRDKVSTEENHSQSGTHARAKKQFFKCDVCSKKFHWKSHLETHSVVHKDERPFTCAQCNATYKRVDKLQAHILHRCPKKEQQTVEYFFKRSLRRKEVVELTNTNNCPSCLKAFDYYSLLIKHTKVCTAYAKLVKKEKQKMNGVKYNKEEINGSPHREYECFFCNEIFVRAKYFAEHLQNKHDVQFFIHKC